MAIPSSMLLPGEAGYQKKAGYTITTPTPARWGAPASGGYGSAPASPASQAIQKVTNKTNKDVKARETEVRKIYDQIIKMYSPGGAYGQGTEAMLGRQKQQSVAAGQQSLVSSGLSNTTQAAGLDKKFEEEVGMPTRAKLEDVRYGALSGALGQKAGFITDIQNQLPDFNLLAQLIAQGYGA